MATMDWVINPLSEKAGYREVSVNKNFTVVISQCIRKEIGENVRLQERGKK